MAVMSRIKKAARRNQRGGDGTGGGRGGRGGGGGSSGSGGRGGGNAGGGGRGGGRGGSSGGGSGGKKNVRSPRGDADAEVGGPASLPPELLLYITNVSAELSSLAATRAAAATPAARYERRARAARRAAEARERDRERHAPATGEDAEEEKAGRARQPDSSAAAGEENAGTDAATAAEEEEEEDEEAAADAAASQVARAALRELSGHIQAAARDGVGSRVLEQLLDVTDAPDAVDELAVSLLAVGGSRAAGLATHRCGSHVLQRLLERITADAAAAGRDAPPSPALTAALGWLDGLSVPALVELVTDARGSHVFRAAVTGLAGVPLEAPRSADVDAGAPLTAEAMATSYITEAAWPMADAAGAAVVRLARVLVDELPSPAGEGGDRTSLRALATGTSAGAALQALLAATVGWDAAVAERLAVTTLGGPGCPATWDLSTNVAGSRLVETAILAFCGQPAAGTPGTVVGDILGAFLLRLTEAAAHPTANYVLSAVLCRGLRSRGAVATALDGLEREALAASVGHASGREGVALALGRAAAAYGDDAVRGRYAKALARVMGATGPDAKHLTPALLVGSLARLTRWRPAVQAWADHGYGLSADRRVLAGPARAPAYSTPGILTARVVLAWGGVPGQLARESLGGMPGAELVALAVHGGTSRLLEQVLGWRDGSAGEFAAALAVKLSSALLDSLLGGGGRGATGLSAAAAAAALAASTTTNDGGAGGVAPTDGGGVPTLLAAAAASPCASRVLQAAFAGADAERRRRVTAGLTAHAAALRSGGAAGRHTLRVCRVDEYARRAADWTAREGARNTRARLFADILDGSVLEKEGVGKGGKKRKVPPESKEGKGGIGGWEAPKASRRERKKAREAAGE